MAGTISILTYTAEKSIFDSYLSSVNIMGSIPSVCDNMDSQRRLKEMERLIIWMNEDKLLLQRSSEKTDIGLLREKKPVIISIKTSGKYLKLRLKKAIT